MPLTLSRRLSVLVPSRALALALTLALPPVVTALPAAAQGTAGAFLAMREARAQNDFATGARYLETLVAQDPGNPVTLESLVVSYVSLGEFEAALPHARALAAIEPDNRAAALILMVEALRAEDYQTALAIAEQENDIHPLLDGLALAWTQLGVGRMSDALQTFGSMAGSDDMRPFALYCRALALALVGDVEGALAIMEGEGGVATGAINTRAVLAYAQVLGLSERYDDALALLDSVFLTRNNADVARLYAAFEARQAVPFDVITSAAEGMAEVLAVMGAAMVQVDGTREGLIYAQSALWLRPDLAETRVLVGEAFESMGQLAEAARAYALVPAESPLSLMAQIGEAGVLENSGQIDEARAVLIEMVAANPESVVAPQVLGDFLRRNGDHAAAIAAYDQSVAAIEAQGNTPGWTLYFARAVSHERSGDWTRAEADFRAALALEPEQPTLLNYLGYSLVERHEKLDEALDMIERAVAAEPDSGAIVDSLAWALFRLGRYDEALPHMERAVELLPTDPILNDHLGDVYWAVGRQREARFQWSRALSFGPSPDMDDAIVRRKLEVGLDVVRAEQGLPPLHPE